MQETANTVIGSNIEALDDLIAKLQAIITQADESPLVITLQDPPRPASYRQINNISNAVSRKPPVAEAIFLQSSKLVLRCTTTDLVRLMIVETMIAGGKNGRGEVSFIVTGAVAGLKRVKGGYEVEIDIDDTRRVPITPGQKLRESIEKEDVTGWNRWCQDIKDTIDLAGISLPNVNLAGYDLCCADLTDADLSGCDLSNAILAGAELSRTNLDNVKVTGADFFRARMSRKYNALLDLSGMPEKESVIFSEK